MPAECTAAFTARWISDSSMVVPPLLAGADVHPAVRLREEVLPPPLPRRLRVLPSSGIRECNSPVAVRHVAGMDALHILQMIGERPLHRLGQHGDSVLEPLAIPYEDLVRF